MTVSEEPDSGVHVSGSLYSNEKALELDTTRCTATVRLPFAAGELTLVRTA